MTMLFEHKNKPLLSKGAYKKRLLKHFLIYICIIGFSLGLGVLGYHYFESLPWIDALLNAAMILGGMGPVNEVRTNGGKIFASIYALFSGVVFIGAAGIILAPVVHRFFHKFHLPKE